MFYNIPQTEEEMMIEMSLKYSKELDEFNKTTRTEGKAIKSTIHPVLLDHVIREGERSIKTLKLLGLNEESAKFEQQHADQIDQYTQE